MGRSATVRSRRSVLAAFAGTLSAAAGCLVDDPGVGTSPPTALSLSVKSMPADEDPPAASIGRTLTEHLVKLGVDAQFEPKSSPELFEDILIEHEFDVFVARFPPMDDPDVLRPLLHSRFDPERGWQNPFGMAEGSVDAKLDAQYRVDPASRQGIVQDILRAVADHQPFSVVGFPEELTAVGLHLPIAFRPSGMSSVWDVLALGDPADRMATYRVGILDGRITTDLNPLRPLFPLQRLVLGLVYDRLAVRIGPSVQRWLATDWTWQAGDEFDYLDVHIHPEARWHDGEALTAADVAFTYDFLTDVTLGAAAEPMPAPRFRGRTSLIDHVDVLDDAVRFAFDGVDPLVARRALTVPIVPRHIWRDRAELTDGAPVALRTENDPPVGSGPFAFDTAEPHDIVTLDRNEAHFAIVDPAHPEIEPDPGLLAIDRVEFVVPTRPPTVGSAVNLIAEGELDVLSMVPAQQAATVTRADGVTLGVRPTTEPYVIGFNLRHQPTASPTFRRIAGRLIDRTFTAAAIFRGYAEPANSPLRQREFVPEELAWTGESALGAFPGTSGMLDVEAARTLFREAGFVFEGDVMVDDLPDGEAR